MTKRFLTAILTAAILMTMSSCRQTEIRQEETAPAVSMTESMTDTEAITPAVSETVATAEETEPITEAVIPETTEAPETETEPPIEQELPDGEPVLDLEDLPPDIPAPKLIHGRIEHPMIDKNNGINSYFYGIGITGQPYRDPSIDGFQYDDYVSGWYYVSPDDDALLRQFRTQEQTVSLTLGEETLTASYSTFRVGDSVRVVRSNHRISGQNATHEHLDGRLGMLKEEARADKALSVFLTDKRYVYCTLVTPNKVEDIVLYDAWNDRWLTLHDRVTPTPAHYDAVQAGNIHPDTFFLEAQLQAVSPNNDRFLYTVSDNNDPDDRGGAYYVYDTKTQTASLVCDIHWEGGMIASDTEDYQWLDNDTLYIEANDDLQMSYHVCKYRNGRWTTERIADVYTFSAVFIGSSVYYAEKDGTEVVYRNTETGQPASGALNDFLKFYQNEQYPEVFPPIEQIDNTIVFPSTSNDTFSITFFDITTEQTHTVSIPCLDMENIWYQGMYFVKDGILLKLKHPETGYHYICYLPNAYLEYLRS